MIVKKIIIMLLVLLILYVISKNNENFVENISQEEQDKLKSRLRGEYDKSVNEKRAIEAAARAEAERQRQIQLRSVMLRTPDSKLLSMQKKKKIYQKHM